MIAATQAVAQPRPAREPAQLAQEIFAQRDDNTRRLQDYTWKVRVELRKDKELKSWSLDRIAFGPDGALQKTPVGTATDQAKKKKQRTKLAAKRDARAVAELRGELQGIVERYALPTADALQRFLEQATVGQADVPGTLRIRGRDVLEPSDELTLWIDAKTKRLLRTKVLTLREGFPVTAEVEYRQLDEGLAYPAFEVVKFPKRAVELTVERFDVTRAAPEDPSGS